MKAYPDNIKEISFLATLDQKAPYHPWFAGLGAAAYWGIGLFGTKRPRVFDAREFSMRNMSRVCRTNMNAVSRIIASCSGRY